MNERIQELAYQAEDYADSIVDQGGEFHPAYTRKLVELIKQAIYDDVKGELIDDAIINEEPDRLSREYLKGCNGGTVDALCHIKNFGVDIEL